MDSCTAARIGLVRRRDTLLRVAVNVSFAFFAFITHLDQLACSHGRCDLFPAQAGVHLGGSPEGFQLAIINIALLLFLAKP